MKLRIAFMVLISACCLMLGTMTVFGSNQQALYVATEKKELVQLSSTIAQLYEQANISHKQEVYLLLQSLKQQLNDPAVLQHGSAQAWIKMKSDLKQVEQGIIHGEAGIVWREPINRMRLAVDAIMQSQQGTWLQYEALLKDDIQSVRKVSGSNNKRTYELSTIYIDKLVERLSRIETAALMVSDVELMNALSERGERLKQFLDSYPTGWNQEQHKVLLTILNDMDYSVQQLFVNAAGTVSVPTVTVPAAIDPKSLALFFGALITGILALTSYRKYKQVPYGIKNWRV